MAASRAGCGSSTGSGAGRSRGCSIPVAIPRPKRSCARLANREHARPAQDESRLTRRDRSARAHRVARHERARPGPGPLHLALAQRPGDVVDVERLDADARGRGGGATPPCSRRGPPTPAGAGPWRRGCRTRPRPRAGSAAGRRATRGCRAPRGRRRRPASRVVAGGGAAHGERVGRAADDQQVDVGRQGRGASTTSTTSTGPGRSGLMARATVRVLPNIDSCTTRVVIRPAQCPFPRRPGARGRGLRRGCGT